METPKYLIVNADDFGQSVGVNRGIIKSYEEGIVTGTSLMVRWPAAVEAAAYARLNPALSVGLHLDLGEWRSVGGEWRPLYEVVDLEDTEAVRAELLKQVDAFRALVGRDPSHLDSHQHVHLRERVRPIAQALAMDLGLPLRHVTSEIQYCGEFYGQSSKGEPLCDAVSVDRLVELLAGLSANITELACHPGLDVNLNTMYRTEREWEVGSLTDGSVLEALDRLNIRLYSFRQFSEDFEITF